MAEVISVDSERGKVVVKISGRDLVIQYVENEGEYLVENPGDATVAVCIVACHTAAEALEKLKPKQFELFA